MDDPPDHRTSQTRAKRVTYKLLLNERAAAHAFPKCDSDLHRKRRPEILALMPLFETRGYISMSELREEYERRFEKITDVTFRSRVGDYAQLGFLEKLPRGSAPGMKGTETPLRITAWAKARMQMYDKFIALGYAEAEKLGLSLAETDDPGLADIYRRMQHEFEKHVRVTLDDVEDVLRNTRDVGDVEDVV